MYLKIFARFARYPMPHFRFSPKMQHQHRTQCFNLYYANYALQWNGIVQRFSSYFLFHPVNTAPSPVDIVSATAVASVVVLINCSEFSHLLSKYIKSCALDVDISVQLKQHKNEVRNVRLQDLVVFESMIMYSQF